MLDGSGSVCYLENMAVDLSDDEKVKAKRLLYKLREEEPQRQEEEKDRKEQRVIKLHEVQRDFVDESVVKAAVALGGVVVTDPDGRREIVVPAQLAGSIPDELLPQCISVLESLVMALKSRQIELSRKVRAPAKDDDEFLTVEQALEYYPGRKKQWLLRKTQNKKFKITKGKDIKFDKKGFLVWMRSSS